MAAAGDSTPADVMRMASLASAERTGVSDQTGSIEAGKRADIVTLSESLEAERGFPGGEEYERAKR